MKQDIEQQPCFMHDSMKKQHLTSIIHSIKTTYSIIHIQYHISYQKNTAIMYKFACEAKPYAEAQRYQK